MSINDIRNLLQSQRILLNRKRGMDRSNAVLSPKNGIGDYTGNNFINIAFSTSEMVKIVSSNVPAHANPKYSTSPGNATTDKIFLLSITEVNNLLGTGSNMCTKFTIQLCGGCGRRAAVQTAPRSSITTALSTSMASVSTAAASSVFAPPCG